MSAKQTIKLFLCGDVMTGREIDQLLLHPNPPELYKPYIVEAAPSVITESAYYADGTANTFT